MTLRNWFLPSQFRGWSDGRRRSGPHSGSHPRASLYDRSSLARSEVNLLYGRAALA